jgi:hypothetical protein
MTTTPSSTSSNIAESKHGNEEDQITTNSYDNYSRSNLESLISITKEKGY